jgi:hypothetical protein
MNIEEKMCEEGDGILMTGQAGLTIRRQQTSLSHGAYFSFIRRHGNPESITDNNSRIYPSLWP